jgi:DNA-binding MurR/RpiR family transcriptional regulator
MLTKVEGQTPSELIAAAGDDLTPTERRIAEAVIGDPSLLAFGTVAELARQVGTSRPSVVRFAVKLGFAGYRELQESVQEGLTQRFLSPSDRIRHVDDPVIGAARAVLIDAVAGVFDTINEDGLEALADPIARATAVWIISGETSRAGANALMSGLSIVRPLVRLVDSHSVGTDLAGASRNDVAVVFDFYRYRRHSVETAGAFANLGVPIIAITDGPLSPLAALADSWIGLKVPAVGPFDSSVPAVAVAELLVALVGRTLQTQATERIDRTEEMWAATGTFVPSR